MRNISPISSTQKNYLPQLDGVRGVAILLVVSFHYFGFIKIFSLGWIGVDLFFVLSGYLITSRLYATKKEKKYFSKFYINRALRILPVYYLTLIFFYAGFNFLLSSKNLPYFSFYNRNWWSFVLFFENWTFINELPANRHLLHFWSLAVEEQFYLIWPLFLYIFLCKKNFYTIIFLILAAIITVRCFIYFQYPKYEDYLRYFCNTFCRMDGFIIGGYLFLIQQKTNLKRIQFYLLIPFIIIVIGVCFTNTTQSNPFISTVGYTILALFFAGIINFITINPTSFLSRFFQAGWLKYLGRISYGLYIYHWLILLVLQSTLTPRLNILLHGKEDINNWITLIISLIASLAISIISYTYFESYFLKLKK